MERLRRLLVAALVLSPAPSLASPLDRWAPYIAEASARYVIPEPWIRRVMTAESGGNTTLRGRPIVSRAGAMGLMQVMPGTWGELRATERLGADPHDPRDNILAGTAYLRAMYDRFGYPGLFAAYNAGPARYAAYLSGRSRLPRETVAYVRAVAGAEEASRLPSGREFEPPGSVFALGPTSLPVRAEPEAASLFVALSTSRAGSHEGRPED